MSNGESEYYGHVVKLERDEYREMAIRNEGFGDGGGGSGGVSGGSVSGGRGGKGGGKGGGNHSHTNSIHTQTHTAHGEYGGNNIIHGTNIHTTGTINHSSRSRSGSGNVIINTTASSYSSHSNSTSNSIPILTTPKKHMQQKKRPLACVNCRYSKLKCQFSSNDEPKTCDRCKLQGIPCKVEGRYEERQHLEDFSHRLTRVENLLESLVGKVDDYLIRRSNVQGNTDFQQLSPVMLQRSSYSSEVSNSEKRNSTGGGVGVGVGAGAANEITNTTATDTTSTTTTTTATSAATTTTTTTSTTNPSLSIPESPASSSGSPVIWRKRDRKLGGTAKEFLADLNPSDPTSPMNGYDDHILSNKRIKLSPDIPNRDLVERGLITPHQADECLAFFSSNIARYLPVLVLNYVTYFDSSVRQRSPLLFASVLAVSSLYHPDYHSKHTIFRKEFETLAERIDRSRVELWDLAKTNEDDIQPVLDDILALIISGAWLGGELGFRSSLVASEMFGYLLPPDIQSFKYAEPTRSMLGAIGLVTYIIEKRLRIIHDIPNPIPPDPLSCRRDSFLPLFLCGLSGNTRNVTRFIDPAELKATANVELCALMMTYQQELSEKLESNIMLHWNNQLDKWLGEWMGKLTVHLKPSTWKPVMLTFHYAKLFLNLRVIQGSSSEMVQVKDNNLNRLIDSEFIQFIGLAEKSALGVLDMLVFDEDIQRMVKVGPVFYATIFVTAAAFILKLLSVGPNINYNTDDELLLSTVSHAVERLESSIACELLSSHAIIHNLRDALNRVIKNLQTEKYGDNQLNISPTSSRSNSQTTQLSVIDYPQSITMDSISNIGQPVLANQQQQQQPFANMNYQWSFLPANTHPFITSTILPMQIPTQGQPRLVPEGMTPLLHPQPVRPSNTSTTQWPLSSEGFRQVYGNDPNFLIDAHSTHLLQSLFDTQFIVSGS